MQMTERLVCTSLTRLPLQIPAMGELPIRANNMLCENCKRREATCFITLIVSGVTTNQKLCQSCFEPQIADSGVDPRSQCDFCGNPTAMTMKDFGPPPLGNPPAKYDSFCLSCFTYHNEATLAFCAEDLQKNEDQPVETPYLRAKLRLREWLDRGRDRDFK